jgi:hypothetical protein
MVLHIKGTAQTRGNREQGAEGKVTENFGKLYSEVFNIVVFLRDVIRLTTWRNIIWMGHVTCIGKMRKKIL